MCCFLWPRRSTTFSFHFQLHIANQSKTLKLLLNSNPRSLRNSWTDSKTTYKFLFFILHLQLAIEKLFLTSWTQLAELLYRTTITITHLSTSIGDEFIFGVRTRNGFRHMVWLLFNFLHNETHHSHNGFYRSGNKTYTFCRPWNNEKGKKVKNQAQLLCLSLNDADYPGQRVRNFPRRICTSSSLIATIICWKRKMRGRCRVS